MGLGSWMEKKATEQKRVDKLEGIIKALLLSLDFVSSGLKIKSDSEKRGGG